MCPNTEVIEKSVLSSNTIAHSEREELLGSPTVLDQFVKFITFDFLIVGFIRAPLAQELIFQSRQREIQRVISQTWTEIHQRQNEIHQQPNNEFSTSAKEAHNFNYSQNHL